MRIWVDGDALPREARSILQRASQRLQVPMTFVANSDLGILNSKLWDMVIVPPRADAADQRIVQDVEPGDLVITADIPLAAEVVERGAEALDPRGKQITDDDARAQLSMRDFMESMRSAGMIRGGPSEYGDVDKQKFAAALDRWLTRRLKPGRGE
jgi:hypothetical protein